MNKDSKFVKVAEVSQIKNGQNKVVYFYGREVVIFHVNGQFYAMDNRCPHQGGPLSEGEIENNVLVCPWHGARFDMTTGRGLPGPHKCDVRIYHVKIEDENIKIAMSVKLPLR
ncbi:MAG: Rieske (2Fe-2S) protein [Calditrichaeota bacterium]|nr:MAG: Rieske (2Fe-2S) protein [Calditrichota bacterium]